MKRQNLFILLLFVLLIAIFSLISCVEEEEIIEVTTVEENEKKHVTITIAGELERTGIFSVPANWTLRDLFIYAGVKDNSDFSGFDISSLVEDGKAYYVPNISTKNFNNNEKVNINTADIIELSKIKGIGETLALKIIEYRKTSPFINVEDIKNVSGIGDGIYEKIKDFITV